MCVEPDTFAGRPPVDLRATVGIKGDPGIDGTDGVDGADGPPTPLTTFPFTQTSPSAQWNIQHDLGRYPSVTVVDSAAQVVDGDIDYIDANNISVSFSAPFSGVAYLN